MRSTGWGRHLVRALPAWLTARAVVVPCIGLSKVLLRHGYRPPIQVPHRHPALLDWDAYWYRRIASSGYAHLPPGGLRFFPLWPALGRIAGFLLGGRNGLGLILLGNLLALVLGALVHLLAEEAGAGPGAADRAVWLVALLPPAFVLVMAYSEALALALAAVTLLALRRARWSLAVAAGFLAGLCRPVGLLLAVPAGVHLLQELGWWPARAGSRAAPDTRPDPDRGSVDWVGPLAAGLAPVAGCGAYLAWVGIRYGDPFLPLSIQQRPGLRGHTVDPAANLVRAVEHLARGQFGTQLHDPWALAGVVLAVVAVRRLPAAWSAYVVVSVVVALSGQRLGSLERYLYGAVPVPVALACTGRRTPVVPADRGAPPGGDGPGRTDRAWRVAWVLCGAGLAGYATAAFLGAYVP